VLSSKDFCRLIKLLKDKSELLFVTGKLSFGFSPFCSNLGEQGRSEFKSPADESPPDNTFYFRSELFYRYKFNDSPCIICYER
jgi:hypothetical protein